MTALSARLSGGAAAKGFALALLVAIGIGVHNLGEGLAIGASFAIGELQLGTFLIVGFMIHNVTEGLGIAAPIAKTRVTLLMLAGLALVAGAPTILGAWIGGYTTSDVLPRSSSRSRPEPPCRSWSRSGGTSRARRRAA